MSIDFEVAGKLMRTACRVPFTATDLGATQGPQKLWDKWCKILHSRPLLAHNFIIETSYFCTIFFYICLITCITVYSLFFEKAVQ